MNKVSRLLLKVVKVQRSTDMIHVESMREEQTRVRAVQCMRKERDETKSKRQHFCRPCQQGTGGRGEMGI